MRKYQKALLAACLLELAVAMLAFAQTPTQTGGTGCNSPAPFASAPVSKAIGTICTFNDAPDSATCTGGGASNSTCRWNGTAWVPWVSSVIVSETDPVYVGQRNAIASGRLWQSAGSGSAPTGVLRGAAGGVANYDDTCRSDGANCTAGAIVAGMNINTVAGAGTVTVDGQMDQVASVACSVAGDLGKYGILASGVLSWCAP